MRCPSRSPRRCCHGRPVRGTSTACGARTGMTACGGPRVSARTGRHGNRCPPGWPTWPGAAAPTTSACTPGGSTSREGGNDKGGIVLQAFDERNLDVIVSVGGRLTHRREAAVSPFDSAVQGGDAVWEGLRLYQGRIFRLA